MPFKNRDERLKYAYEIRERNRKYVEEYKRKIGKCQRCGYNKIFNILHFHHKNKKNKKCKISDYIKNTYSLEVIKEEIKKCELICPNCHAEEHFKSGY